MVGERNDRDSASRPSRSEQSHPEQVLSQALRAMAGGRPAPADRSDEPTGPRLTATQILLIAALLGAVIGIVAGLVVLLT